MGEREEGVVGLRLRLKDEGMVLSSAWKEIVEYESWS